LWKKIFHLVQKRAGKHKENKGSTDESPAKAPTRIIRTSPADGWGWGHHSAQKNDQLQEYDIAGCPGQV
jgi:hypothetical protein